MFGRGKHKTDPLITDPLVAVPGGTFDREPDLLNVRSQVLGLRARMQPGSWFQNRQTEQGNDHPFVVIGVKGLYLTLQGVDADGYLTHFVYTLFCEGVQLDLSSDVPLNVPLAA